MTGFLCEAVKAKIRLDYPDKRGVTLRSQLEHVEDSTGIHDELLDSVNVPLGGEFIWEIFWKIAKDFTYTELEAFCNLTGLHLGLWEINALSLMASAKIEAMAEFV